MWNICSGMRAWLGVAAVATVLTASAANAVSAEMATVAVGDLPPEAHDTLRRIDAKGPFAFRRDGVKFGNFERRLPLQPSGYYREYTVATPGARTRGARRIVTGGDPPAQYYYTSDHYRSFRRIVR
ncbi:MAG TPA: ribonuclease domain-containing protein [Rhodocyclaceae bacterium]|nr:ribonuclease domain-containing protein [Rhodocyclaceae bacterium]